MPKGIYKRTEKVLSGIRAFNATKIGIKRPTRSKEWIENAKKARMIKPIRNWKGGITKDKKAYNNLYYARLSPEKQKIVSWRKNKRNRMKRNAPGEHTLDEWDNLKAQYNWICPCCGKKEPEIVLSEDHIIPIIKGGSDNIENIQPLCRSCNCKKHTKIIRFNY